MKTLIRLNRPLKDENSLNLLIMLGMRVSGLLGVMSGKVREVRFGQMGQCMKDGGRKMQPMEKEG